MLLARRAFLLGGGALSASAAQKKKTQAAPPNILLIIADGIGSWMLGCTGNTQFHTPNIDLLAKGGTRFAGNFVCAPSSSPSRATLFTGRAQASPQTDTMLFDVLAAQGYSCGYAGQWDMGNDATPQHHCSYWQTSNGLPDPITARAKEFLDQQTTAKPFFLTIGYAMAPDGQAGRYYEMYAKTTFEAMGRDPISPTAARDQDKLKDLVGSLRKIAAAITAVDDQIPSLVAKLHDRNLSDNTLILFTSPSGSLLGRHGLWGDGDASNPVNMYEEVVQVPMIWNWAGRIPVESVRNELVSFYDFLPAVCDVAGVAPPANLHGRSYATLALGKRLPKKQPWRNTVYGRYKNVGMARDSRYKLVLRDQGKGLNEFFDLTLDAREKLNRYDAPAYLSIRDQLTRSLAAAALG